MCSQCWPVQNCFNSWRAVTYTVSTHHTVNTKAKYIMWTHWHRAHSVQQQDQNQIGYTDGDTVLDSTVNLITVLPLRGIHMGTGTLLTQPANSLVFAAFGFAVTGTVTGIQAQLDIQRVARIQDHVVQLWYHGAVGVNRAVDSAEDVQHYGDAHDLWATDQPIDFNSTAFGIVVDLQPHHAIPSSTPAIIASVQLRLYVE